MYQFPSWLSPWLDDNDLLVGQDLTISLKQAILTECNFLVVFISDDAAHSEWVRKEIVWAKQRQNTLAQVFVLPVLLNCDIDRLTDLGLKDKKAIIIGAEPVAKDVAEQLVNQISAHCAQLLPSYTSIQAEKRHRLKTYLLAVYVALLVASAAGGSKVMSLFYPAAGVTVISFAFTFLITDCVNQLYGQKEAQHFISAGFVSLMLGTLFIKLFAYIPTYELYPTNFNSPTDFYNAYASILSPPFRMFVAGLTAYLLGQLCNIWIFDRIRRRTTFEQRGKRNVVSTLLSQLVDTAIFVPGAFYGNFLGFSGYPAETIGKIFLGQFLVKAAIALFVSYPAFLYLTKAFRERAELKPLIG